MLRKGKFIVIEGLDGSGKTTQFNLLVERLRKIFKKKLLIVDFPRYYDSIWGKMIGGYLIGKYGKLEKIDPHLSVLPYMLDQYTWCRDIGRPWIKKGGIILSNRFFTSNAHQIAKLNGKMRSVFRKWLWSAGYESLGILKPDLVLFLDVPPKYAAKMNKTKKLRQYLEGRKQDLAERDRRHQEGAYKEYLRTIRDSNFWVIIKCVSGSVIGDPQTIHNKIWKKVIELIK